MTARLPVVAGDSNAWGSILNTYLGVEHNSDGTHKNLPINLKDTCAIDGVTDDSIPFTAAYTLASSTGRGLFHPGGTLIKGNDTLQAFVPVYGIPGKSIFKLKNGANVDLFSANTGNINLSAAAVSGSNTGVIGAGFFGITLDGNKANQTSGTSYPIRGYGYACSLENVEVTNGYSGGILWDWNGSSDPTGLSVINHWRDVQVHGNNGIGIQVGGPTDSHWYGVDSFHNGTHNYHLAPNAVGFSVANCHGWGVPLSVNGVSFLSEAGATYLCNCQMEGSDTTEVVFLGGDSSYIGGDIFPGASGDVRELTSVGLQLGQSAGLTPYPGQILQSGGLTTGVQPWACHINTKINDCQAGAIDYQNERHTTVFATIFQPAGNVLHSGHFPDSSDFIMHQVSGLTADGTPNKGSFLWVGSKAYNIFFDKNGNQVLLIDANNTLVDITNNALLRGWAGNYSTNTYTLHSDTGNFQTLGNLAVGQSATTPDPGAGGTITTANIGLARVTPAANRTGVILQAGTISGQKVTVANNSGSFTITFAAAGTSNVAQGVSLVIAANGKYDFTWDSVAARWY